jgi:hypothetical protein
MILLEGVSSANRKMHGHGALSKKGLGSRGKRHKVVGVGPDYLLLDARALRRVRKGRGRI